MGDRRMNGTRSMGASPHVSNGTLYHPKWRKTHHHLQHPNPSHHHHHLRDGILLGFLLVTGTCLCVTGLILAFNAHSKGLLGLLRTMIGSPMADPTLETVQYRGGLFAAVLTSGHSSARAQAVRATWGKGVSNLTFFAHGPFMETTGINPDLPIVEIPSDLQSAGDAEYTRMFYIIHHICTFRDEDWAKFDWFLISGDDAFFNIKQLAATTRKLESKHKVLAGVPLANSIKSNDLTICSSVPAILLSRRLVQDTCSYLSRCQEDAARYGSHLALSACVYHYSGVQCTPIPQNDVHKLNEVDVKALIEGDRDEMSQLSQRLDQVLLVKSVPQPWLMLQLHTLGLLKLFKEKGKALEKYMETKSNMESYVYVSYVGPYHHATTSGDVIYTSAGETFSSQSCGGRSSHGPHYGQLIQSSMAILQSINTDPMKSSYFTVQQVYSANMDNKTKASIIDVRVSSRVSSRVRQKGSHTHRNISELARVVLTMRHLHLRTTNKQTFNKLNQLWLLVPVQYLKELLSFLKFWADIKEYRLGVPMNVLLLPIRLNGNQIAGVVPKHGIYNSEGEIRRIISFPRALLSEEEAFQEGIAHVRKAQQDHVIFLTSPNIRFRPRFLRRCLAVVSSGNQYRPIPYTEKHIPNTLIYGYLQLGEEDMQVVNQNHTLWLKSQSNLQCFSSKSSKDTRSRHTISASDPDLFWISQPGAK